jgi:hypothetical protein
VADRPIGSESREFAEFRDGGGRVGMHQSRAEILAGFEISGILPLDFAIFANRRHEVALVAVRDAEVVAHFGVIGLEPKSLVVLLNRAVEVADVVISQSIVWFAADGG